MKPQKYTKRPVTVEACQYTANPDTNEEHLFPWLDENNLEYYFDDNKNQVIIPTLEGEMRASIGDYIIKGVQGEFYPCKPDIFYATYVLPATADKE